MTKVLITGATGNVGIEVIAALNGVRHSLDLYAGVRDVQKHMGASAGKDLHYVHFDFEDAATYKTALEGCDVLYLLRPPHISDVSKFFAPIIATCVEKKVKHIVFISVQGAEKSTIIPHHKIEKLIVDSRIPYTFLRPAYFMQNFTTTLRSELIQQHRIVLPAGNAKFTLIDIRDIGRVSAEIVMNISSHKNRSYELTSDEVMTFSEMATSLSIHLGRNIQFISPNPLRFFMEKRKESVPAMKILVMIMLHYLPRFQEEPKTSKWVEQITNRPATSFEQFVIDNTSLLTEN